jgi:hypothetical protein
MSEPVAWMDYLEHSDVYDLNVSGRGIPLYTHPAKTLTDEEITAVSKEIFKDYKNFHHYQIDFARAILRKAQEK